MEVRAILKNCRVSPRKCRLVADYIRGMRVNRALDELKLGSTKVSRIIFKLLWSVVANAENNLGIDIDKLIIHTLVVDGGRVMKRRRARARGRYGVILKRSCHIKVVVGDLA